MTHLVEFLDFRRSSQGLNTGSNPVGTTTPSLLVPAAIVGVLGLWRPDRHLK